MAHNHRMQPVGEPHLNKRAKVAKAPKDPSYTPPKGRSNLPRLSEVIAGHLNEALDEYESDLHYSANPSASDAEEDFQTSYSIAQPKRMGSEPLARVSEIDAEDMLHHYRTQRDKGQDQPYSRGDIKDAYRNRNDY